MAFAWKSLFGWKTLAAAAVVFVGIQFIPAKVTNPPVAAELQAPREVKAVLRNSCYSCHSNETKLAWFDKVAPASWLVVHDVNDARRHLNFSEIAKLPAAQQKALLFQAVYMIQMRAMPLPSYVKAHTDAAVSPKQLAVLRNYLARLPDVAPEASTGTTPAKVETAPNGVAFMPEYKNWQAISSTDRWDNHTMREILGNEVAVKAIAENHINPWPDGTKFAKVAWVQTPPDDKGEVRTGAFYQVEFMVKDAKKYAKTGGWGWGRWRGTDLKPYGDNAEFQNECVGCHAPLRKNDYVFTMPITGGAGAEQ
jgi:mono/diheme cytochrome c family protein